MALEGSRSLLRLAATIRSGAMPFSTHLWSAASISLSGSPEPPGYWPKLLAPDRAAMLHARHHEKAHESGRLARAHLGRYAFVVIDGVRGGMAASLQP